jgi:hypothetical protein
MESKALKDTYKGFLEPPNLDDTPEIGLLGFLSGYAGYLWREYAYRPVRGFFRQNYNKICRSYTYAKFGWENYDWDMSCASELFNFKLKRLYKALKFGHSEQEPEVMAALKEFIKITYRLYRGRYEDRYHRSHDKKWGKIESRTEPNYDKNGKILAYTWISWRKGTKDATKKVKAQELKEFRKCFKDGEKDRCKDIDRMAAILKEFGTRFWD